MIRGFDSIVRPHEVQFGRFYLEPGYEAGPLLFQCIRTAEPLDDGFRLMALVFTTGSAPTLTFENLSDHGPLVALPEVHVRVDPPSLSGSWITRSLASGMFLVAGEDAIVTARTGIRGWAMINISTGKTVDGRPPENWVTFDRWSLVIDESGEEVSIAEFGVI